jgi:hypothetical protein
MPAAMRFLLLLLPYADGYKDTREVEREAIGVAIPERTNVQRGVSRSQQPGFEFDDFPALSR